MRALLFLLISITLTTGCGTKMRFDRIKATSSEGVVITPPDEVEEPPETPPQGISVQDEDFYVFSKTKDLFFQEDFEENNISVTFQAFDRFGHSMPDLTKDDVSVRENGIDVFSFELKKNSVSTGKRADIVFVLDITGSMNPSINSVRENVSSFVELMNNQNIKANVCFVTFKDWVDQRCAKFAEDDPNTPENENVLTFLEELSKVSTGDGGDPNENQLAGLIAAAEDTPWHSNAQRIAILITDAYFHFAPTNRGDAGMLAPRYDEALDAIEDNQMIVHIVGPKYQGYYKDFFKKPSLTKASGGLFFDFAKVDEGLMDFSEVLTQIAESISTTYEVRYVVEDNPGLDPTMPLKNRNIIVQAKPGSGVRQLKYLSKLSNMPDGRPEYKKRWTLNRTKPIREESLRVWINSIEVLDGYQLEEGDLVFALAPAEGSRIEAEYQLGTLRENVKVLPFVLRARKAPEDFVVHLNGQVATDGEDYVLETSLNGRFLLTLKPEVFTEDDSFEIRSVGGLHVLVDYVFY